MKKILVIARHEFLATVTRKGYIIAVIGLPLFIFAITGIGVLAGRSAVESAETGKPVAVVDQANVADFRLAESLDREPAPGPLPQAGQSNDASETLAAINSGKRAVLVHYRELDRALEDLRQDRLAACYLIEADYMSTGRVVAYGREKGLFASFKFPGRDQLYDLLRASVAKDRVTGQALDRLLEPVDFQKFKLTDSGEPKPAADGLEEVLHLLGPLGIFFLFTLAIFISSGYLLQGTAEEKQNRVIEILLSSVKPTQLLAGKILGLGAAGLLQVTVQVAIIFAPAAALFALVEISIGNLLLSIVYFVLGYLLFASLMAATGMLGNSVQESTQLSTIWTMTSMIPMFMLGLIMTAPNGMLARGLSYFPLTAPVMMLLRIHMAKVPLIDFFISMVTLLIGIYLSVTGAAKIFRTASLMYGKRPSLPEIVRWLREA